MPTVRDIPESTTAPTSGTSGPGPGKESSAWNSARVVASIALTAILIWMASIVSKRLGAGAPSGPTFTLYRGAPPAGE